jgi:hypothetical protein
MNNLEIFGDVEHTLPYGGGGSGLVGDVTRCRCAVCEEWNVGFAIISLIALIISIIILVFVTCNKKSKFRIPLIILSVIMIVLCITSIVVAISLYEQNAA